MTDDRRTLRLTLEYDGHQVHGWQVQPDRRTVQGKVERALEVLLRHPIRVMCAGRTDAGVHALGQVCNVRTDSELSTGRILRGLNGTLPRDVAAVGVQDAPPSFHPRYDATGSTTATASCAARAGRCCVATAAGTCGANSTWPPWPSGSSARASCSCSCAVTVNLHTLRRKWAA